MAAPLSQIEITRPEAVRAGSRSQLYRLLASALYFPTAELAQQLSSGSLHKQASELASGLPYALAVPGTLGQGGPADLEPQYLALFEVGGELGPPAPLYEGHYGGGRNAVMEECLKFYHYFGMKLSDRKDRELPDHLAVELEFMHVLTFKEASAIEGGQDPKPYRLAQRDFLERHLVDFTSRLAQRMPQASAYTGIVALTDAFCRAELAYLSPLVSSA